MQTWIVGVWVTWWSWEWQNPFRWSVRFSSRLVRLPRWSWEWMTSSRLHPGEKGRGEERWEAKEFQWRRGEERCVGESEELEHSRHEPYRWSHAWEWRTFYFSLHTGKGHLIIATEEQLQCIPRTQSLVVHISMYIYCIDLCLSPSFHCLLYEKLELRSLVSFCAIKKTILSGLDASLIPRLQPNFCHCAKNITKAGKKPRNETGSEPWNQIG